MSMIYFVITCICAGLTYACSQMSWIYQKELFYVSLFITGIFLVLIFIQQEDAVNKKYTVFTPRNISYFAIVAIILILLRDYKIKDYETVKYAFVKLATIINAGMAVILILFYKVRSIFYNC